MSKMQLAQQRTVGTVVRRNLRALLLDLQMLQETAYHDLVEAGILALHDVDAAFNEYAEKHDNVRLNRSLITAFGDFNMRWEDWISKLKPGDFKSPATKQFHEMLLRFLKGIYKAWRCWRIDLQKV